MLDSRYFRAEESAAVWERLRTRKLPVALWEKVLGLDQERRTLRQSVEQVRQEKKQLSQTLARDPAGREENRPRLQAFSSSLREQEGRLRIVEAEWEEHRLLLPNLPHESVPVGETEADNQVLRTWGEPTSTSVAPHWEMGTRWGWLDAERASVVTGSRFVFAMGFGARLERALVQFMLDLHTEQHGYEEIAPPFLVHENTLVGTGNLPKFAEDLFKIENTKYYLIPTAEAPLTNYQRESVIEPGLLPYRYTASTPCFRSEAGAAGRDTRGLIRLHQFTKVEMVQIVEPSTSYDALEAMTGHAEKVLQLLELPYRVVALCTGDLGFSAAKTYDLEVWLPSSGTYREISSCSNCEAFQARRAAIRYRPAQGEKPVHVHTLNGSGLAVGRTLAALLECHQRPDGRIAIPKALRPYLGGREISPGPGHES